MRKNLKRMMTIKMNFQHKLIISLFAAWLVFASWIMLAYATTAEEEGPEKKYCEGKGEWKNGRCHIDNIYDRTAYEDAVCNNEDADTTNIKMCMSEEREHHYEDQQIEKWVCEDEGFEWKYNGGCDTKGDEKKWDEIYYKVGQALAEREEEDDDEETEENQVEEDDSGEEE
jgi:hypothetical protein